MHQAGQLISGPHFPPIKMMDEAASSLLFYIFIYSLATLFNPLTHMETYDTVREGTENNTSVKRGLYICGFKPLKAQPLSVVVVVVVWGGGGLSSLLLFPLFLAHSLVLFVTPPPHIPSYMPLESLLIRLIRGISLS